MLYPHAVISNSGLCNGSGAVRNRVIASCFCDRSCWCSAPSARDFSPLPSVRCFRIEMTCVTFMPSFRTRPVQGLWCSEKSLIASCFCKQKLLLQRSVGPGFLSATLRPALQDRNDVLYPHAIHYVVTICLFLSQSILPGKICGGPYLIIYNNPFVNCRTCIRIRYNHGRRRRSRSYRWRNTVKSDGISKCR